MGSNCRGLTARYAPASLPGMEQSPGSQQTNHWASLRLSTGLSQREVERRLDWKRGHLSLIERGLPPTPEQARALRQFYVSWT